MESENHNHECGCCNHDHHGRNDIILENSKKYEETWVPVPKVCAQCGKEYLPSDYRHQSARYKFCSKVCQRKFHNLEKSKHFSATRTCVVCGKVFTTNNFQKKTCSSECSEINRYRSKHPEVGTVKYDRKCPACGKEFTTNKPNKKFCCDACKKKFFYSKQEKVTFTRRCVVCGSEFTTSNASKKTCSEACSKKNRNRQKLFSSYKGHVMKEFEVIGSVKPHVITKSEVFSRTCPNCGKEFTTVNPRQKFCSRKCWDKNHAKSRPKNEIEHKTCPVCGKEFDTNIKRKMFCCRACKKISESISYRENHSVRVFHKTCPVCGKEFDTGNHFKVYCSKECKLSKAEETRIKNLVVVEPRACVVCGKVFTPTANHRGQKTCSKECRRIYANIHRRHRDGNCVVESRICQWCGKEFTPTKTHPHAKNCSRKCQRMFSYHKMSAAKFEETKEAKRQARIEKLKISAKNLEPNTCVHCGKEFFPKTSLQLYCSEECRRDHKYPVLKKTCAECGKEFETRNKKVVCCSKECSKKHYLNRGKTISKHNIGDIVSSKCVYCGKEFSYSYIKGTTRKYCSLECRMNEWKEKHPSSTTNLFGGGDMAEGTCVHCGSRFSYKWHGKEKMYCSEKCMRSAWLAKHPGYFSKYNKSLDLDAKKEHTAKTGVFVTETCNNPDCGKTFEYFYVGGSPKKYCCAKCRQHVKEIVKRENRAMSAEERIKKRLEAEKVRKAEAEKRNAERLKKRLEAEIARKVAAEEREAERIRRHQEKLREREERKQKKLEEKMLKRQRCLEEAEAKRRYRIEHAEEWARIHAEKTAKMDRIRRETAAKRRKAAKEKQRNHLKHVLQRARAKGLTILYKDCLECGSRFGYVKELCGDTNIPDFCCDSCKNHWNWEHGGKKQYEQKKKSDAKGGSGKTSVLTTKRYNPDGSITVTKRRVSNLSYGIGGLRYNDLGDVVETDPRNFIDEEVGKMFGI